MKSRSGSCSTNRELTRIDCRLNELSTSQTLHRVRDLLRAKNAGAKETRALMGIALTEMSARPVDARFVEWVCVLPLRHGFLGKRARVWAKRRTVGPFQLRDAPLDLTRAVDDARAYLAAREVDYADAQQLAIAWHGPGTNSAAPIRYAAVLRRAMDIASSQGRISSRG